MGFLAFGLAFGFAWGAWRELGETEHPTAAGLTLVMWSALLCAFLYGRRSGGARASATATAVASADASATAAVQVNVNLPAGPAAARWDGLDAAPWMPAVETSEDVRALETAGVLEDCGLYVEDGDHVR